MATAYFNTPIYSDSAEKSTYDLDIIITKSNDFSGSYKYRLEGKVPTGVAIDRNLLIIPPFLDGDGLTILVTDKSFELQALATTTITASGTRSFTSDSIILLNSESFGVNKAYAQNNWSSISTRGIEKK